MRTLTTCLFIMLQLFCIAETDTAKFSFNLSVRQRLEVWNGMNARNYGNEGADAIGNLNDKLLYQRIIAGFTYKPSANLNFTFNMQDSRAFGWSLRNSRYPDLFKIKASGTETPYYKMNPGEQFFEINDAYIEYTGLLENITIKLGRQKIFYGDNRIFGPGEWGNTGRWTWDALKISYKNGDNFVDVFAGGTKIHDPEKPAIPFTGTEFLGGGVYAHYGIEDMLAIEPFYAYKSQGSADYINTLQINRHWIGARVFNEDFHSFIADATYVRQFGSNSQKQIKAFAVFAKIGYQFRELPGKPILSLRESYASGGKRTDGVIRTFEPAFGARDRYYGRMNILSWSNLDNREVVLEVFPVKGMWLEIKYNWFFIPEPKDAVILNTMKLEEGKRHLGDEFNIFMRYQVHKNWQLVGCFGYFRPGGLRPINGQPARDAQWYAVQVLYSL